MCTIIGDFIEDRKSEKFDSKEKFVYLSSKGLTICNFSTLLDQKQTFYHLQIFGVLNLTYQKENFAKGLNNRFLVIV